MRKLMLKQKTGQKRKKGGMKIIIIIFLKLIEIYFLVGNKLADAKQTRVWVFN